MIRGILSLFLIIPAGLVLLWLKITLWPYVLAYGYLIPWILVGSIVILIINSIINGKDE